ncbi:MAG: GAF domain-containing sensor histidine kinase [Marinibacterium sp.]
MTSVPSTSGEDIVVALARVLAIEVGDAFLQSLADVLRAYMDADMVFIGIGDGDPVRRVRAIYAVEGGHPVDTIAYDLTGAPCEMVYQRGEPFLIPCDLARKFPKEAGLDSYLGVPLRGESGVFGHLAVFSRKPIGNEDRALGLLSVLALHVEAELRRRQLTSEREQLVIDLSRQADRLKTRQRMVREQNAHKTRLLGIIAHDLRNPLAGILAQAELADTLLVRTPPTVDRARAACAKVVNSAERMSSLIDATLQRVREEHGDLALERAQIDLAALLRVVVEGLRPLADQKSIDLQVAGRVSAPGNVDEDLIMHAIENLMSNAIKYTYAGGRVTVAVEAADDGWQIFVADTGQGLTEADKRHVFGWFQTLSAKPTGGEAATGLGLFNVREIVEAHGGTLNVDSAGRDQGATFTIHLPVKAVACGDHGPD